MKYILPILKFLFSGKKRIAFFVVLVAVIIFLLSRRTTTAVVQTVTGTVEKGTLVTSVSASGTITAGNSVSLTTGAAGTVNKLFVKIGDTVKAGQTIATLTLDRTAQQNQASAYASYLSAKNQLASAKNSLYSLQSAAFSVNQKFINDAVARDLAEDDPTYIQEHANWLKAEADYNNQASVIKQAEIGVSSAYLSYQNYSSTITAPASGVITNLIIAEGLSIQATTSTSTNSNASTTQKVGTITTKSGQAYLSVNLSEVDAVKVAPGQKVTVTLDALSGKSFVGKVVVVDTSGSVSSSVTTYPATIAFETGDAKIYPNMAATAKIITSVSDNVLLVPSSAITKTNGEQTVKVVSNGETKVVTVETGSSNDTQTAILSGLSEGDTIVTSTTTTGTTSTSSSTSVFSSLGGARGGFGGSGTTTRAVTR